MASIKITQEEFTLIENFIDGKDRQILDTNIPDKLQALCSALQSELMKTYRRTRYQRDSIQQRLERLQMKHEKEFEAGDFTELGLDSIEVFQALYYCMGSIEPNAHHDVRTFIQKVMPVFFEAYASWMFSHKERICIERPLFVEFRSKQDQKVYYRGPWFWRASQHTVQKPLACQAAYASLCQKNPGLAKMLDNAAHKYYDFTSSDIRKYILSCPAFKGLEPNKKEVLNDGAIYCWKKAMAGKLAK